MSETLTQKLLRIQGEQQSQKSAFEAIGIDMTNVPFEQYHEHIQSGGVAPHEVRFFDIGPINGTTNLDLPNLITSNSYYTGQNAVFPEPPERPWLDFVEWTHTPEDLSNLQYRESERGLSIPGHIDIGAIYKTSDDRTHMWISPSNGYAKSITLLLSKPASSSANIWFNFDWGDGSAIERYQLIATNIAKSHTYTAEGEYHIQIWTDNNQIYGLGNGSISTQIATTNNLMVTKIYISDYCSLRNYACYNMRGLQEVSLPKPGVNTELPGYMFQSCFLLKHVSLPRGYTAFPIYFLNSCKQLKSIVIPNTIDTLGLQAMVLTPALERFIMPRGLHSLPDNFFDIGSAYEMISDTITSVGANAFNSWYLSGTLNLSYELIINGSQTFNNAYSLKLRDLNLYIIGASSANLINWAQLISGTIAIRGASELTTLTGQTNFNSINRFIIGANFTNISGTITTDTCLEYVFEATVPPILANVNNINGLNKLAHIYVPDIAINVYKTASIWSTVAGYIKPMSELPN